MSSLFELYVCIFAALGVLAGSRGHTLPFPALFPLALFFMLWPVMVDVELRNVRRILLQPRILSIPLVLNFVVSPLLSFWLSRLLLADNSPGITTGMLLFGMMPSGGMAPAYTTMAGGNKELSLAVMTVSLPLSIAIVPLWTALFFGKAMIIPPALAGSAMAITIALPMLLAWITRRLIVGIKGQDAFNKMKRLVKRVPGFGLLLMVFGAFAINGNNIARNPFLILRITGFATVFLIVLFVCSSVLCRRVGLCRADSVSLAISSTAKNNAISMSLAALLSGPETMLTLAIAGSVVQLPVMLFLTRLLGAGRKRQDP